MTGHTISVKDLVKHYGRNSPILDHVSFYVDSGDFAILYGQSGCGKTTLLNIMGGLDRPDSGSVLIDDIEITNLHENDLAKVRLNNIGFVFQDYNLLPELTVRENVSLPIGLSGKKNGEWVEELLEEFGLHSLAEEKAAQLSGGESQRAAIARAMANHPRIILADEPTGNLDSQNAEKVLEMFNVARKELDATIILASHDADLASYATRTLRLKDGRIENE